MLYKILAKSPQSINILGGPFRGAKVFLNPANSKRKIFGLYEYCLNEWIKKTIENKEFVLDVGANTGYHTYGFAYLLKKNNSQNPIVIAFEPETCPELDIPKGWDMYSECRIEILKKYVGENTNDNTITLDDVYSKYLTDSSSSGLIKIDIEGAETEALKGAIGLLQDPRHDWLIEIHGDELIPEVASHFVKHDRPFVIKELSPLPIIGAEKRTLHTTWLVTI